MEHAPDFIKPLFETCSPFGESKFYFLDLIGFTCSKINILTPNRVMLENVAWEKYVIGKVRIFKHDKNDEFYIAVFPKFLVENIKKEGQFTWIAPIQMFDNLPEELVKEDVRSYIGPFIYELNHRDEAGILTGKLSLNPSRIKILYNIKELEGEIYGPATQDEVINHLRLKFAFLLS
jgi:hypothetical protein